MVRQTFGVLHFPKTAGTSLVEWLTSNYGKSVSPQRFDGALSDIEDFSLLDPELRQLFLDTDSTAGGVLVGHFALSSLLVSQPPSNIVTILREPRCRLLSQQAYHASIPAEDLQRWFPSSTTSIGSASLREVLGERRFANHSDNVQLRMLLSPHPDIPRSDFISQDALPRLAAEAIERCSALGFSGVLEEGSSLWGRLSDWLGKEVTLPKRTSASSGSDQSTGPATGTPTRRNCYASVRQAIASSGTPSRPAF